MQLPVGWLSLQYQRLHETQLSPLQSESLFWGMEEEKTRCIFHLKGDEKENDLEQCFPSLLHKNHEFIENTDSLLPTSYAFWIKKSGAGTRNQYF